MTEVLDKQTQHVVQLAAHFGVVVISKATADAIDDICARLERGERVPLREIANALYGVYAHTPDHLLKLELAD
jgi:hypothetical protein